MVLTFECIEPEGTVMREVRPARLSFETLKGYYDKLKEFDTVFNGYVANNIDAFIYSFVKGNGSEDLQATGIIWEVDDVGILYLTNISVGNDAYAHFNFWDRRFKGRENLIRGMMRYVMKEFDLHRITSEVGLFAAPWLPSALERIGFVREGRKREAIWYVPKGAREGEWFDSLIYSMLRHEVEEYAT
ncbi:hypothetical protein LCGC14_1899580 [marine sediment metagenome]|uniref:N-acetyltransferase domain-containing protein n=1 Tax=marine sediment metagenome TaxID=412755 RepID=A0A0F9GKD7_9ZZZZ